MVTAEFKKCTMQTGLAVIVIFATRILAELAALGLGFLDGVMDDTALYYLSSIVSIIIIYGGGVFGTSLVYKKSFRDIKPCYNNKDKRLGKAVSWVVPGYGAGQIMNIAVIAISFLIFGDPNAVANTFNPVTSGDAGTQIINIIFLVFQLSILAPVVEEYWFRGIIQTSVEPYGYGYSIMVSSFLFALAHGNVHQFCYTFVLGLVLGYVRYATGSLVAGTIIHFIVNSLSAVALVIMSLETTVEAVHKTSIGAALTGEEQASLAALVVWMIFIFIMIIVGIASAIGKIKILRLYRPKNNYPELTKKEKFTATIKNPAFIVGVVLCFAYMILGLVLSLIMRG